MESLCKYKRNSSKAILNCKIAFLSKITKLLVICSWNVLIVRIENIGQITLSGEEK
jgi:hypothetical protein